MARYAAQEDGSIVYADADDITVVEPITKPVTTAGGYTWHEPDHELAALMAAADDDFLEVLQNHPGVESAIGALQSGNGMERCRDRSEIGFERYISLAILGRNLQTLGRLLIAKESPKSEAAFTRRKAA